MLGNLSALNMGVQGLQNFQHSDVLEKIKMQVRDMKVHGFLNPDFSSLHSSFSTTLQNSMGFNSQNLGQSQQTAIDSNGFPFSSTVPNKDGQQKNIKIFVIAHYLPFQAQVHPPQVKHQILHNKIMAGVLKSNLNKLDR